MKEVKINNSNNVINAGTIEKSWEYSQNPREEGLLKQLKYIKWENVENFDNCNIGDK